MIDHKIFRIQIIAVLILIMSGCVISTTNNEEIINEVKKEIIGKNIEGMMHCLV